jgi:hypothetical protein
LENLKTRFTTERVLKGRWSSATPLTLITLKAPAGQFFENSLDFPPTGERLVLFLARDAHDAFLPVDGVQGVWPLDKGTDRPLRMGFGTTLKQVQEAAVLRPTVYHFGGRTQLSFPHLERPERRRPDRGFPTNGKFSHCAAN